MDDKVFNLLEKMYVELTTKIDGLSNEMQEVKSEVKDIGKRVTKIEIVLENQINPQIMLLSEGQEGLHQKVDALSEKVDRHDIKIQVIEGGKRA